MRVYVVMTTHGTVRSKAAAWEFLPRHILELSSRHEAPRLAGPGGAQFSHRMIDFSMKSRSAIPIRNIGINWMLSSHGQVPLWPSTTSPAKRSLRPADKKNPRTALYQVSPGWESWNPVFSQFQHLANPRSWLSGKEQARNGQTTYRKEVQA